MDLISIITVSYNAKDFIKDTIESVINQRYKYFEYILIDGGSTDGTVDIIKMYLPYISYFVSESDEGIYDAMNKGVVAAKGDWVIFMNAGDRFVNSEVLSAILFSTIDKNAAVIYGNTIAKYPWGNCLLKSNFFSKKDINLPFCHQSTFVRNSLIKKAPFDLSYKVAADYNFFYTLYRQGHKFHYCNLSIALYDAIGFSAERVLDAYVEVARVTGNNHGLNYILRLYYFRLRTFIMSFIPQSVVDKYRMHRYASS